MSSELAKRAADTRADAEVRCTIAKVASVDHEGGPVFGERIEELCSVLKLPGEDKDISARIGTSPDHPSTPPRREDAVLLLRVTTKANVDDVIEVAGIRLKVTAISPSYDSVGKVAFHVVLAVIFNIQEETIMKLYYHPVSTTSRPVVLFAAESGIKLDYQIVDLFTGEQYQPEYSAINPSHQVPVLEDGDFRLTESSAILKYLADKTGSPAYPSDLRKRARVNERMDWLNTGFYRDFSYGFLYPQIFPFMRRPDDNVQAGTVAWGKDKAVGWLKVLDESLIGPRSAFVCGEDITIADYLGAMMVLGGEAIDCKFAAYPNISRWLGNMKALKSWAKVNEAFYKHVVDPNKGKEFVRL